MKCIDAEENLDALLDREIEMTHKRKIEIHFETCRSCQTKFRNLRAVSEILKQSPVISAPASLDKKVFGAFENFHREKHSQKATEKSPPEKNGWFGIPRFAYAAALFLFALATVSAFQLGRMSATNVELSRIETPTGATPSTVETARAVKDDSLANGETAAAQTIRVPVVREKIIRIPVVREKIIVRTVYRNSNKKDIGNDDEINLKNAENQQFTVKSRLRGNQYSTQINLKGFRVISELKPVIIKGENNEE